MTKHQKVHQDLKTPETESTTLPVIASPETLAQLDADVAALAAEARELTDDVRVGDDLRFKKGEWTKIVGDKDVEIGATTAFAVDVPSYTRGWIEWRDRKPVRKILGRPIDGFVSPVRDRLGDNDKTRWPRNARGETTDPWQENFSIVLRDLNDSRLCTWTTTSYFGSRALGALLKVYVREQKKHPGLMPVVLLGSENRATASYGDVAAPTLRVVDWQPFGEGAAPPGMRNLPPPPLPPVQELLPPSKQKSGGGLEDEIPF